MIFAREIDDSLTGLVKKIDAITGENKKSKMGSFVIFTNDSDEMEAKLKEYAKKEGIKNTPMAIDNPSGPKGYNVAKDAAITVVLYNKREIKANYAFKKGEMKTEDIEKILKDIPKILEKK